MLIRSSPTFIIKKTMEERRGFRSRHVEGLIAKAKLLIRATDEGLADVLAQHIALGENLIWMALNKNDVKTAVTQFANMSKLRGLERSQVDVNHTGLPAPAIQIILDRPAEQHTIEITPIEVKQIPEQ